MQRPIDRAQIDRLVLDALPAAHQTAWRLTGDHHRAEELVQDTLLRVLKKWKSYRGDSSFRTWMMTVMVNAHRDRLRKHRGEQSLDGQQLDGHPARLFAEPIENATSSETAEHVLAEINRLPPRQREVAVVCLGEGLSTEQAALVLGTTSNNVSVTLHAVRKRIAAALGLASKLDS